jgi:hypothetical protein
MNRDDNNGPWLDITYFNYWDGIRTFHLNYKGKDLVFDSPFLPFKDAYSDYFLVYLINDYNEHSHKHLNPENIVDIVPLDELIFDETLKNGVLRKSADDFFGNFESLL